MARGPVVTKVGMSIDNVEIWFEIADGQNWSILDKVICSPHNSGEILSFHVFILLF